MKWDKPTGSTQHTADGRYAIMHATVETPNWIAYALEQYGKPAEIGVKPTDIEARQLCEDHEREMVALRKAG